MTITPRGESFLPDFSIDELNDLYQKEGDPKAKIRLLAAILRKEDRTLEEVSFTIKHPLTTVGDWLRRLVACTLRGFQERIIKSNLADQKD